MSQPLLIEHNDGVDTVTLNRPEHLNALDPTLIDALNKSRPKDTKGVYLKKISVSSTMGAGVRVDTAGLSQQVQAH